MIQPELVEEYLSSGNKDKQANELKKHISSLKQQIDKTQAKIRRVHEGYESNPPIYTTEEADERIKVFRSVLSKTEGEKKRLESIIEQSAASNNAIDMLRRSLEAVRHRNLDEASSKDKQDLMAGLGILVYPSEDHETVRITSELPILKDRISPQIISMASPKL